MASASALHVSLPRRKKYRWYYGAKVIYISIKWCTKRSTTADNPFVRKCKMEGSWRNQCCFLGRLKRLTCCAWKYGVVTTKWRIWNHCRKRVFEVWRSEYRQKRGESAAVNNNEIMALWSFAMKTSSGGVLLAYVAGFIENTEYVKRGDASK